MKIYSSPRVITRLHCLISKIALYFSTIQKDSALVKIVFFAPLPNKYFWGGSTKSDGSNYAVFFAVDPKVTEGTTCPKHKQHNLKTRTVHSRPAYSGLDYKRLNIPSSFGPMCSLSRYKNHKFSRNLFQPSIWTIFSSTDNQPRTQKLWKKRK